MLLVVLGLLALSSACLGQQSQCLQAGYMAHLLFVDADTDADGNLHLLELIDTFKDYDANGDGRISRHEYVTYQVKEDPTIEGVANDLYTAFDVTGDHHLEMDDYFAFYRNMDSDGDDNVSEAEFTAYFTQLLNSVKHHSHHIC